MTPSAQLARLARPAITGAIIVIWCAASGVEAADRALHLAIGDPARKDREAPLVLDAITDTATGETLTADEFSARVRDVRLLLFGETHTAMESHRAEARVIELLQASGRRVLIGLEMFPYTEQRWLDAWTNGRLTERGFLELARWYEHWSYNWGYYRDIFVFAREHRLPMIALNAPREVISAVRRKGFANLTREETAHVPAGIDVSDPDHLTLFKASFEADDPLHGGMTEAAWTGMLAAQATWDGVMAHHAVQALERAENRDAVMVVLVGAGHVQYGLGIERQAKRWFEGRIAGVITVPVTDRTSGPVKSTQASYANFVWGVAEEADPIHPMLSLSTRALEGETRRQVILVERGSIAERAGFRDGDVLLSLDGAPLGDSETYNRLMAGKRWGDSVTFVVRRGTDLVTLRTVLRRAAPGPVSR